MAETILGAVPKMIQIEEANWRDFNAVRQLELRCFTEDAWPWWDMLSVLTLPSVVRLKAIQDHQLIGFVVGDVRYQQSVCGCPRSVWTLIFDARVLGIDCWMKLRHE